MVNREFYCAYEAFQERIESLQERIESLQEQTSTIGEAASEKEQTATHATPRIVVSYVKVGGTQNL